MFLLQLIQPHVLLLALFRKLPDACLGVARLVCGADTCQRHQGMRLQSSLKASGHMHKDRFQGRRARE